MASNGGKSKTVYDISAIVRNNLGFTRNPSNIMSGFRAIELSPLNPNFIGNSDLGVMENLEREFEEEMMKKQKQKQEAEPET